MHQLFLALRFYASGNFLLKISYFGRISTSTACHIIRRVTNAIAALKLYFIKIPNEPQETREIYEGFYDESQIGTRNIVERAF